MLVTLGGVSKAYPLRVIHFPDSALSVKRKRKKHDFRNDVLANTAKRKAGNGEEQAQYIQTCMYIGEGFIGEETLRNSKVRCLFHQQSQHILVQNFNSQWSVHP